MKYLFINGLAGLGSTGRIVEETCRELMAQGHTCRIAYGRGTSGCEGIETYSIGSARDYALHAALNRVTDRHGCYSHGATRKFLEWVRDYDPDVIWLHNVHGYYLNLPLLFDYLRGCGKELRWTLHDCWAFTGHCAYFDYVGCARWKTGCPHCPQKGSYPASMVLDGSKANYAMKKRLFTGIPNLPLIVPSHWLERRVKESFLKDYPVKVVYNTVDREVFRPRPGDFREKYGLANKKILLGVANVWEPRKGLGDFLELAALLDGEYKIVLVGLSEQQIRELPNTILGLPRTKNAVELAEIYTAADVYLNPSVEETFGMTALEAQCCGTPSVVYEDTACEEVAREFGGMVCKRGAEHLYQAVKTLLGEE